MTLLGVVVIVAAAIGACGLLAWAIAVKPSSIFQERPTQDVWNALVAIFTFFLASVTFFLVLVTFWQYQLGEITQRPWVAEQITLASALTFKDGLGLMYVRVNLTNRGNSTAVNVHPFCKLMPQTHSGEVATSVQKACGHLGDQSDQDPNVGFVIFAGDSIPDIESVDLVRKDFEAKSKSMSGGEDIFPPLLVCCVDYRFTFRERKHHQTRLVYELGEPVPNFPGIWKGFKPEGTISDLLMIPSYWGDSAD